MESYRRPSKVHHQHNTVTIFNLLSAVGKALPVIKVLYKFIHSFIHSSHLEFFLKIQHAHGQKMIGLPG